MNTRTKRRTVAWTPESAKRWFQSGLGVLSLLLLLWCWQELHKPETLPIKNVRVEGDFSHIDPALIRRVIKPYLRRGFFALDIQAIQDQLLLLPWAAKVSVQLVWPDTLAIQLTEQQPLVRWENNGLLTAQGALFFPYKHESIPADLPVLSGPEGTQVALLTTYKRIASILQQADLKVAQLQMKSLQSLQATLNNGITLQLGRRDVVVRVRRFVQAYQRALAARQAQIVSVDLRYPSGLAVQWSRGKKRRSS